MNLVKIADMLKNAPDQALMQEMQNPSGSAPSYMILSELQRRKKLRGSLMNNEPQSSVAEDIEAESSQANQMGIGSMGMNPMEQAGVAPEGYAQGGEVVHAAGGWWQDPNQYSNFDPTDPKMQRSRIDEMRAAIREQYGVDPENLGTMTSIGQGLGNMFGSGSAQNQALNEYESAKKGLSLLQTAPTKAPPVPAPTDASQNRTAAPQNKTPAPTGGLPTLAPQKATSDDYSVNPLLEELRGIRKETAGAYQKQADMYQQQADEVRKAKASDIGMALMQAGLGIAGGRSQYAVENIGQGASPAMQAYMGMDRERRKEMQKLALGQGQLGIEQLGARMKGVTAEGELGLGGEKMDIARRSAAADEMRARATAASVANQASQWKQDNAAGKLDLNRATEIRNYIDKNQLRLTPEQIAGLEAQYAQLMKFDTMGALPKGVTVNRVKP